MNSLAFLSRQLDTRRPSAPAQPRPFNRVPTWAAFPPLRHLSPRRSNSSPALLVPAPGHPSPPAPSHLDSFLRILLVVWTRLTFIWSTLRARLSTLYRTPVNVSPALHSSPPPRFTIDPPPQTSSVPTDSQDDSSRANTPPSRKPGIRQPKTLVLDLDETLIHSTSKPMASGGAGLFGRLSSLGRRNSSAGHMVEVVLQGKSTLYHVYKRPFVDFFLRTVRHL
jgi:CTD nuclear envelope phosphatase 1